MSNTFKIDSRYNSQHHLYNLDADTFWKLFLKVHDRNTTRNGFVVDLEKEVLELNRNTQAWKDQGCGTHTTRIEVGQIGYASYDFQRDGKLLPKAIWSGYTDSYKKMRERCAKYFGVHGNMLPSLPRKKDTKEDLQSYFLNRGKPSLSVIRRVS
mgnify:FL=1